MVPAGNARFMEVIQLSLFTPEECNMIIRRSQLDSNWQRAGVYNDGLAKVELSERSAQGTPLMSIGLDWPVPRLLEALVNANDEHFRFDLRALPDRDAPSVIRYDSESADHFRSHRDVGASTPTRKLTFVIQLSAPDSYVGCDLVFSELGAAATREQGVMIVFPAFEQHHVTPVLKGSRFVVVGWVHGPTFS